MIKHKDKVTLQKLERRQALNFHSKYRIEKYNLFLLSRLITIEDKVGLGISSTTQP